MSRNSSGTYTLPVAAFLAGGIIRAADHNSNYSDIATALTQSLATTGVSTMTGPIKAASGSAAAPSITFASGTSSGFYLAAANQIAWSAAGAQAATFNADGTVDFANAVAFANGITVDGASVTFFPSGTVMLFVQTAAPTGWTKSVAHNDKALRVVSGAAGTGGSTAFTSVFAARTIAEVNLPAHSHAVTDPGHTHVTTFGGSFPYYGGGSGFGGIASATVDAATDSATTGITIGNTGSGTAIDFAVQYVDCILATRD
jgi:hypothetical protein